MLTMMTMLEIVDNGSTVSRSPSAHLSFPSLLFLVEDIDTEVGTRALPSEQVGSPGSGQLRLRELDSSKLCETQIEGIQLRK